VGALHLCRNVNGFGVPSSCMQSIVRTVGASLVMAIPMVVIVRGITKILPSGAPASALAAAAASIAGAVVFLGLQTRWGAPEIASLKRVLIRFAHRPPA
jgi:hypothetical protein